MNDEVKPTAAATAAEKPAKAKPTAAAEKPAKAGFTEPNLTDFDGYDLTVSREHGSPRYQWSVTGTSETDEEGEYFNQTWAGVVVGSGVSATLAGAVRAAMRCIADASE